MTPGILILGGTGAIGIELQKQLMCTSWKVGVSSRSRNFDYENICFLQGDALNESFVQGLCQKHWDVIVDLMSYKTPNFAKNHKFLLKRTARYIFVSSARVFSHSREPISINSNRLLETSKCKRYLATDEYALAKARQEDILESSGYTNWSIVRPYITYNSNRLQLGNLEKEGWLYRALNGRSIVICEDMLDKLTTLTHASDVAAGILKVAELNSFSGRAVNLASSNTHKWRDVLDLYSATIEAKLNIKPKIVTQDLNTYLNWSFNPKQVIYDRMYDRVFDDREFSELLKKEGCKSSKDSLREELSAFLENPSFGHISWRSEALKDKALGEFSSFTEMSSLKSKSVYTYFRFLGLGSRK